MDQANPYPPYHRWSKDLPLPRRRRIALGILQWALLGPLLVAILSMVRTYAPQAPTGSFAIYVSGLMLCSSLWPRFNALIFSILGRVMGWTAAISGAIVGIQLAQEIAENGSTWVPETSAWMASIVFSGIGALIIVARQADVARWVDIKRDLLEAERHEQILAAVATAGRPARKVSGLTVALVSLLLAASALRSGRRRK